MKKSQTRPFEHFTVVLGLIAALVAVGCEKNETTPEGGYGQTPADTSRPAVGEPWFVESSEAAGVAGWVHESGSQPDKMLYMPEIVTGGGSLFDADGDGDLDLYLIQGGRVGEPDGSQPPNALFMNDGSGKFVLADGAGVEDKRYGMGSAAADFDGDGDIDLYVTNVGRNTLLQNDGTGQFTDVTDKYRVGDPSWGTSAAWFDYDLDGDLDLFVTNYVRWTIDGEIECRGETGAPDYCQPNNYQAPARDILYRNDGDWFTDVSAETGIATARGNGLGVVTADFNGDGRDDIFVSNDSDENRYWVQQPDGTFKDLALIAGNALNLAGEAEAGMGVAHLDFDSDGDQDIYLVHLRGQTNTFYENDGTGFGDATNRLGLGASSLRFTGFGVGFGDFDLDGGMDLYIGNGKVLNEAGATGDDPYEEENLLFSSKPGGTRFVEVLPRGGVAKPLLATSRGVIFGDINNDGACDLVVCNRDKPPHVLMNGIAERNGNQWIGLDVRESNGLLARGALARLEIDAPPIPLRVDPHWGYCSSHDSRLLFGLGSRNDEQIPVVVTWRDGTLEKFTLAPGSYHRVVRGTGTSESESPK